MADVLPGQSADGLCQYVARVVAFRVPTWTDVGGLDTATSPSGATTRDLFDAAASLAAADAFSFCPSVPRDDPPPPPPQPTQPPQRPTVVEVPSSASSDSTFDSPAPRRAKPYSAPHASKSVAFDCDASPSNPNSVPLWHNLPAPSAKRTSPSMASPHGVSDPSLRAVLALAKQAEAQDPVWVSTAIPTDDIFSLAEEHVLRDFPAVVLAKKETDFDQTKRALQEAAAWVVRNASTSTDAIRAAFIKHLTDDKAGLAPVNAAHFSEALTTLDEPDASRAARLRAWWELAMTHLRCHKQHFKRVDRIVIGTLSRRPTGAAEVADWLAGKVPILPAPEVGVPVKASQGF